MRHTSLLLAAIIFALPVTTACQTAPGASADLPASSTDDTAIRALLADQAAAWNAGDIEGFMQGYWQSPDLRFASGGNVMRGFDSTLAGYKARYSTREAMGTLQFSELEILGLANDAAVVHGRWQLTRETDTPSGLFTLIMRQFDGNWKIISDTTTSAD